MVREFTCIICPNGCEITAELEKTEDGACRIRSIEGAACPRYPVSTAILRLSRKLSQLT